MNRWKYWFVLVVTISLVTQLVSVGYACGPEPIQPIYVFSESPDPPFNGFVQGNIGIVRSTFGRKTLFIAYKYLNGGSFTGDEQKDLIEALTGKPPEEDDEIAIKNWIAARKEVAKENLPEIYQDRRNEGFDFFPNCTRNAFEVAIETLSERVAKFGSDDPGVKEWLRAQDQVFENCQASAGIPRQLGPESPTWLRKDRAYQIGAAFFYQLNFDAARTQFEKIAADMDSPWQQTADYLVARTLVREASLNENEKTRPHLYEQAEIYLVGLLARGGKFHNAARRLHGLVAYRLHPEERVRELAQELASQSDSENLRQDLIDYTWLLDKFDEQVRQEEAKRKKSAEPAPAPQPFTRVVSEEEKRRDQGIESGELIQIWFMPQKPDGEADYQNGKQFVLPYDVTEAGVIEAAESSLGRKLSVKESVDLKERYQSALQMRRWRLNPNLKWRELDYEGCYYRCNPNEFDLVPSFLRMDDLTDWIFTFQADDPKSLQHALIKWKETRELVWLITALTHAEKTTPGVQRLLNQAESVPADSPAYATLAYHRVRLNIALDNKLEARRLLEGIINTQIDTLPISSRNQFLQQRMEIAESLTEFLHYAGRKPVTFYQYGTMGSISQILDLRKELWGPEYVEEHKEEFEQAIELSTQQFLPWEDRFVFDDDTAEMIAWHFSTTELFNASRDPALPDYLRRQLALVVWTRAILLGDDTIAAKVTPDLLTMAPEMSEVLRDYVNAKTSGERSNAALFALLKFPNLTPFVVAGIPEFSSAEMSDYYFETAWWCPLRIVDYNGEGNEVPKKVPSPGFLSEPAKSVAERERVALNAIGSGKSFLGRRVLEWAKRSPEDPRIPEALFIAIRANESYKYGCESWEKDEQIMAEAESLLHERYSGSMWTTRLDESRR